MDLQQVVDEGLMAVLYASAPFLIAALLAGVAAGVAQTVSQVNEASISFLAKLVAVGALVVVLGPAVAQKLGAFSLRCFTAIGQPR